MEKEEYKLCYIDGQKAYFTNNFEQTIQQHKYKKIRQLN